MPASQVLFLSSTLPDIFILVVKPMNSPVDAGYGKDVKFEVGNQMSRWLDVDEKKSRWSGDGDGKLTASNRRVLMTMWVAEAKEIVHQKVDSLWRYFEKTNARIITADGTATKATKMPEGTSKYEFADPIREIEERTEAALCVMGCPTFG